MACENPYMKGHLPFGCRQCKPCRISDRRLWVHRLLLEQRSHLESCFVTLTYDEKHLPSGGTLVPRHATLFLKRLRKALGDRVKIRYFLVGEYGEVSQRPHYHAAIFGLPSCTIGAVGRKACVCFTCSLIRKAWGQGFIYVGTLTKDSASYIAGYVTKKLTTPDDKWNRDWRAKNGCLLGDRHPEFMRPSKNPGLGALCVPDIAATLSDEIGMLHIDAEGDVPSVLIHNNKKLPLGRYLKEKLREALKFPQKGCPPDKLEKWSKEMSELFEAHEIDSRRQGASFQKKMLLIEQGLGDSLSIKKRFEIFNKKGSL